MPSGLPDWTKIVAIKGEDAAGNLVTVLLDSSGRIVMVPYGTVQVAGTATVTQSAKDREIQGKDGVTLRTITVDANGQMIMVPRGQSGNYMAVDAAGNLASVMKGLDGVTLRTVAVDDAGNIIGVLKGDYAGALKTLALDDQGHILAVLTDPEDVFGNPHYLGAAELAVRLGSIVSYERRGQVIWMDDFEAALLKWDTDMYGVGAAVALSTASARNGGQSVKLTTGNAVGDFAAIGRITYLPPSTRLGVECSFAFENEIEKIVLGFYIYDGVKWYFPALVYRPLTDELQYCSGFETYTTIQSGLDFYPHPLAYSTFKLVVDWTTKKYVRAFVNGVLYDLSAYDMFSITYAETPRLVSFVEVWNGSAGNHYVYADDFILTQNEP